MTKIHLDTDIGGDMDDLCALAMLLKWPDLEITGVTTVSEDQGRRAGYVHYVLSLVGRTGIPCAAGADVSGGYYRYALGRSIEQGAVVVAIGPYTNLMLLEKTYPGILKQTDLFLMGGHVFDMPAGYPQWGKEMDYNIQVDIHSAHFVLEHAHPTLVPVTVTCQTALRRAYLPRLARAGRLGELIVLQAERCASSEQNERNYGETCPGLPRDIINFQHDPLACAIALGWQEGVEIETVPLKLEIRESWLYEIPDSDGIPTRLVTKIDGNAFNEFWCHILCR